MIDDIDKGFKDLNIRAFDGDKPSSIIGVSLSTVDSNLHQHGKVCPVMFQCKCGHLPDFYHLS